MNVTDLEIVSIQLGPLCHMWDGPDACPGANTYIKDARAYTTLRKNMGSYRDAVFGNSRSREAPPQNAQGSHQATNGVPCVAHSPRSLKAPAP
jgi:hypothetical protein